MVIIPEIATCPYCKTEHLYYQAASGNTFDATFYSDGYAIGPMYPDFRVFGKCSSCGKIFKLEDPKNDDSVKDDTLPDLPKPELYDYVKYLESIDDPDSDDEEYIRTMIWWFFNDRERMDLPMFNDTADKAIWKENVLALISLVYDLSPEALLKKAELERNLGRFRHSRSLLKKVKGKDFQKAKRQMLKRCFQRQRKVFVIEC